MDKKQKKLILRYIDLVIKKRWFIIVPVCLSLAAGIFLLIALPRTYQATTLILVESSKVPPSVIQPLQTGDIGNKINTISEQIMSQTYLDKIMEEHNLFSEPDYAKMFPEDKYRMMRKNISINISRSKEGIEAFKLSYKGDDPKKVKNVANSLAQFFIDRSLEVFLEGALQAKKFLEGEVEEMKQKLSEHENTLSKFREANMGRLPEQLSSNLNNLNRLQLALEARQDALSEAQNRLVQIQYQLEEMDRFKQILLNQTEERTKSAAALISGKESDAALSPEIVKLKELQDKKTVLLSQYTKKHPDVKRVEAQIKEMEEVLKRIQEADATEDVAGTQEEKQSTEAVVAQEKQTAELPTMIEQLMPEKTELRTQYNETQFEINRYKQDIQKLTQQIKAYEKRVEDTPKIEAKIIDITRDYESINETYSSLNDKLLNAIIYVNMVRQSKGTRFDILDYAKTPHKPISPDAKKLFLLFVAAGFGIGGGIIFLFDFFDESIRDPDEIGTIAGQHTEIVVMPKIYTKRQKILRYANWSLSVVSMSIAFVLFLGLALLTIKGLDQSAALFRKYVNI